LAIAAAGALIFDESKIKAFGITPILKNAKKAKMAEVFFPHAAKKSAVCDRRIPLESRKTN